MYPFYLPSGENDVIELVDDVGLQTGRVSYQTPLPGRAADIGFHKIS